MNIQALAEDDDAVSPVVGVVLLVAITIVLASVIGVFVLTNTDRIQSTPSADFAFDYKGSGGDLVVTHSGGAKIDASQVYVRGEGFAETGQSWISIATAEVDSASRVANGDSVTLTNVQTDYEIRIVYEGADESTTLQESSGPDA